MTSTPATSSEEPSEETIAPSPAKRFYRLASRASRGPWDVIVIGSGMGGMACAAALAKYGKRVLVLEQHYIPGGFTHMFSRKGYSWDVGVHIIGEMRANDIPAKMLAWLTDGRIAMHSLGNPYDRVFFPDHFSFEIPNSQKAFAQALKEKFPQESVAIDRYFQLIEKAAASTMAFFAGRSLPAWLDQLGEKVMRKLSGDWWRRTTQEILAELTANERLKAVLTAQWGYYGSTPNQSSFALHALVTRHFFNGGYYPVGGAKVFAEEMLRVVQEAGGETLVKALVKEIIVKNDRAVGVRLQGGQDFYAPIIVSAAGARTTFEHLVPENYRIKLGSPEIKNLQNSLSYICMNLGFKGDIRAAGAASSNFWFMQTWDMNQAIWQVDDPKAIAPLLYVSFPSLKNPLHDAGVELRHTGECITFVPWKLFEKWQHTTLGRRGEDYKEFKKHMAARLLDQLKKHIPDVLTLLNYQEMSTPLTTTFFAHAPQGAIYGLESTPARFANKRLRTRTPIKSLYLSGADVTTLGIAGALASGLLTAATIDKRVYPKLI